MGRQDRDFRLSYILALISIAEHLLPFQLSRAKEKLRVKKYEYFQSSAQNEQKIYQVRLNMLAKKNLIIT